MSRGSAYEKNRTVWAARQERSERRRRKEAKAAAKEARRAAKREGAAAPSQAIQDEQSEIAQQGCYARDAGSA